MDGPLAGRVALITAAAAGIGAATARRLATGGAALALVDCDSAALDAIAAALMRQGAAVLALPGDATDGATVDALVARAVERFGRLDILVNGVGGWSCQRTVQQTTEAEWNQGLALNVTSAFLCARAAIPHLIASDAGRIVNISSQVARAQQHLTTPDYVAGKAALLALTRYLAKELGPHGVTVNAVAPGPTWSPRTRQAWSPELVAQIERETALGRIAEPDDIAAVIGFLCTPDARHITGATIDVNGGYTLV
ncbi:MAG: SDR family oxidoreductase [Chloroflexi bacterium]|nr:SDR family oxidoreductase [Chloroflexota bacterium]